MWGKCRAFKIWIHTPVSVVFSVMWGVAMSRVCNHLLVLRGWALLLIVFLSVIRNDLIMMVHSFKSGSW